MPDLTRTFSSPLSPPGAPLGAPPGPPAPTTAQARGWSRRRWLAQQVGGGLAAVPLTRWALARGPRRPAHSRALAGRPSRQAAVLGAAGPDRAALAQRAVRAAVQAGAQYADAHLTFMLYHRYLFDDNGLSTTREQVGVGVRALVHGYWGFAACPSGDAAAVEALGRQAAAQAATNARGAVVRAVELGQSPVAAGTWTTPISIDPFTIPIEEKHAFMRYWQEIALEHDLMVDPMGSFLGFAKQERVAATSDGAHFTQTVYESGGQITLETAPWIKKGPLVRVPGLEQMGRGWELFLDADIPQQIRTLAAAAPPTPRIIPAATVVGRHTLVCDGATMAALLSATVGSATQLDRALGYEANAGGTSFLDDPLAMLGQFKVAAPVVTITANRSAPAQLATVRWDAEGVEPVETTLIKEGILTDFQTTREQAAWLAPFYSKVGRPVRSNGYAGAEDALTMPMQHMPNLALMPTAGGGKLEDLISNVSDGLYVPGAMVLQVDSQRRSGLLWSREGLRMIRKGKLLPAVGGAAAVQFDTLDLWRHVSVVGGSASQMVVPYTQYPLGGEGAAALGARGAQYGMPTPKGEPPQVTSYSVQAPAAIITNQPVIDFTRKA